MSDAATTTAGGFIPVGKPGDAAEAVATPAAETSPVARAAIAPEPLPASVADQLARIEDKASRIEDKYARSESLLSRVEDKVEGATSRMNEVARQSDVAALRSEVRAIADRTKRLPGAGALVLTAIITAVLTVVLTIAVQRLNLQSLLPPPR